MSAQKVHFVRMEVHAPILTDPLLVTVLVLASGGHFVEVSQKKQGLFLPLSFRGDFKIIMLQTQCATTGENWSQLYCFNSPMELVIIHNKEHNIFL